MSERGGFRTNMELKKIIIFLLILNFTFFLNAQTIRPTNELSPYDVIKIQLNALQNNNQPFKDAGIKQVWLFAHPENQKVTGPYERFRDMIYGDQYKILLNHNSHKIDLVMNTQEKYIYKIEILTKKKKLFIYKWQVERGKSKGCDNCWFTSSVSTPVDQGNTI